MPAFGKAIQGDKKVGEPGQMVLPPSAQAYLLNDR